jgi:uncharacterized membrane protein (GlpM family)
MLHSLFLFKLIVAVSVVVGLSLLAEHVSPKLAGLISGYPTGSAILLFFYGLEQSPEFAAKSAVYNMLGLTASMSFVYFYYKASNLFNKYTILLSCAVAIPGFLVVIWLLHFMPPNRFICTIISVLFSFLFIFLFREIQNEKIAERVNLNYKVLIIRAFFAGSIILLISGFAGLLGPTWAGLFSAFPTTLFPLLLIIHYTYGKKYVHTIIKNVPAGMISLIIYSLSVSIVYPSMGIYAGTLFCYLLATIYLLAFLKFNPLRLTLK